MDFQRFIAEGPPRRERRSSLASKQVSPLPRIVRITLRGTACIGFLLLGNTGRAANPYAGNATTSWAARDEAIQSIPFDKLGRDMRGRIATVINNASIYRRLPTQSIDCDPDLFVFLVRNPEVVVDIWRVMGITNMTLDRNGPDRYRASDGQGTTGNVEFAYRSSDLHVIYSEGMYDGPMFPAKLRGQCVMVLKTASARDAGGRAYVTNRLDAFLRIENLGAEIVARTLQPLLGKTADHNFSETSSFVGTLAHTAESNPNGVSRLAQRLSHVEPQVRQQLADLAVHAADNRAAETALAQAAGSKSPSANAAAARIRQAAGDSRDR
jgi:hypothetical protein